MYEIISYKGIKMVLIKRIVLQRSTLSTMIETCTIFGLWIALHMQYICFLSLPCEVAILTDMEREG